jgi:hypothetical protein
MARNTQSADGIPITEEQAAAIAERLGGKL